MQIQSVSASLFDTSGKMTQYLEDYVHDYVHEMYLTTARCKKDHIYEMMWEFLLFK